MIYRISCSSLGIGDAVSGLHVAAGLADAVGGSWPVHYASRHKPWLDRCLHPGVVLTSWRDNPELDGVDMYARVREQLKSGVPRKQWFLDEVVRSGISPHAEISLAKPACDRKLYGKLVSGKYVLLAPFASRPNREWPASHWRRLIFLLKDRGWPCALMGASHQQARFEKEFPAERWFSGMNRGLGPMPATDLILGSSCFVGNDSGMVHLAGWLGVKAICVHSQISPDNHFAPSVVTSICPSKDDMSCIFCRFQPGLGYSNRSCGGGCSAIGTISPERVLAAVFGEMNLLEKQPIVCIECGAVESCKCAFTEGTINYETRKGLCLRCARNESNETKAIREQAVPGKQYSVAEIKTSRIVRRRITRG